MRGKKLLAGLLVGVMIVCFIPVVGYGEVQKWIDETTASYMEVELLDARVYYIMRNPINFLDVRFYYNPSEVGGGLPDGVDVKGKIWVVVYDNRDVFSGKSGLTLLEQFKKKLEVIYTFIKDVATDMNADIVAGLYSGDGIPLAYFYQGEYFLWEK